MPRNQELYGPCEASLAAPGVDVDSQFSSKDTLSCPYSDAGVRAATGLAAEFESRAGRGAAAGSVCFQYSDSQSSIWSMSRMSSGLWWKRCAVFIEPEFLPDSADLVFGDLLQIHDK